MTTLLELIGSARRTGLTLASAEGKLVIAGSRARAGLAAALLDRKPDILGILAVYNGEATRLDWRHARVLGQPRPCALCGRPALLAEPFDQRPCHKTCAEVLIGQGAVPARRGLVIRPAAADPGACAEQKAAS